jgi:hypothetical protein
MPRKGCKRTSKKKKSNKGTGAGGSNTTQFGRSFEEVTCMKDVLESIGYIRKKMSNKKYGYYLKKKTDDIKILFFEQHGLKAYFKKKYDITLYRNPDEAYVIKTKDKCIVKILEKKEQRNEGSVETKLWSGPSLKREYEIVLGDKFIVEYAYCINDFLSKKFQSGNRKYEVLKQILDENNISVFYANDTNYCKQLISWISMI